MYRFSDNTFARAALTGDQHAGVDGRYFGDDVMNFIHRFAVAEQAFHAIGSKKLLCGGQIARQRGAPKCALQGKFQRVHI